MVVSETEVEIRYYRPGDEPAVRSLYRTVFGDAAMRAFFDRWRWQFEGNPARRAMAPLIWVAELKSELVGFLASFGARYKVLDRETPIRIPCDLMVLPEARGRRIGERLIHEYMMSENLIVNALGYSPASGRMFRRLGYREVDAEPLGVRLCNLRPILRDVLSRGLKRQLPATVLVPAAESLGTLLNVGLRAFNWLRTPRPLSTCEIRRCRAADQNFDDLWRRVSPMYPIVAVRDREWVQWRFLDDPLFEHVVLGAFDRSDVLQGYIDLRVSERRNLRFGRIVDLFCDPFEPVVAEALLAAGLARLRHQGADVITCLGHLPDLRRIIESCLYLAPKRLQRPALLVWKGEPTLEKKVFNPASWHLTHADGDDGFSP